MEDVMNGEMAYCAHRRVKGISVENNDGTMHDEWHCQEDCRTMFVPKSDYDALQQQAEARVITPERAKQLLDCRDALIHEDKNEAYHQLLMFCESFGGDLYLHWDAIERLAAEPAQATAEERDE